jgi:hypothetical protein
LSQAAHKEQGKCCSAEKQLRVEVSRGEFL